MAKMHRVIKVVGPQNPTNHEPLIIIVITYYPEFDQRYSPLPGDNHPYVILGPGCDDPVEATAAISSRYLKSIQISYSSSTPLLSDVSQYPLFYRTVPSYSDYNPAIYAIMRHFDWLSLGVVHKETSHYTQSLENLDAMLANLTGGTDAESKASVIASLGLNSYLSVNTIGSSNVRVFVAMLPEDRAAEAMCAAYKSGMTGANYQWILLGDYTQNWWLGGSYCREGKVSNCTASTPSLHPPLKCTAEEMLEAVESLFILAHHRDISSPEAEINQPEELQDFLQEFISLVDASSDTETFQSELTTRVFPSYDAVYTIAHALRRALDTYSASDPGTADVGCDREREVTKTSPFRTDGRPTLPFTCALNAAMEMTDFEGLSGHIHFSSSHHSRPEPHTFISQMQSGRIVPIGTHSGSIQGSLNLSLYGNDLVWLGPSPPRDRPTRVVQTVNKWAVIIMLSLAAIGLVCTKFVLVVNCLYRRHKVIKASSPYLNAVIASGCFMGFLSVVFMSFESLDSDLVLLSFYPFLCNVRQWLITLGFMLAFSTLFAKTWRIYVIFKNPWGKKRPYKDHVLLAMVAVMLSYDLLVLTIWTVVDRLSLATVVELDKEAFTEVVHHFCVSQFNSEGYLSFSLWISIIMVPKAILLSFGIFLVIQTSKIKAKFFRDAKYTGFAIFGIVVACGMGVPTAFITMFLFAETIGYTVGTGTILTCSYLVLVMVFVPKIWLLKQYKKKIPSAVLLGLNPSFHIHRHNQVRKGKGKGLAGGASHAPLMSSYTQMLRMTDKHSSRAKTGSTSPSSSVGETMNPSSRYAEEGRRNSEGNDDGWESVFDEELESNLDLYERQVHFDDFSCIAYVAYPRHRPSIDTVTTEISDDWNPSGIPWSTWLTPQLLRKNVNGKKERCRSASFEDEVLDFTGSVSPAYLKPLPLQDNDRGITPINPRKLSRSARTMSLIISPSRV